MKKSGEIVVDAKQAKQPLPVKKKEKTLSKRVVIGGRPASKKSLDELKSILEKGELPKKRIKKRNS